jgi:signal transduction histidine kinase/ligand-binding sensor domain-containing protein/response regulator of citrate/malate metabolism
MFPAVLLTAQVNDFYFERLTVTDGLPQNTIYTVIQDSKGYLWFGTQDKGLCKYDGYAFKIYNYDPFAENCIAINKISDLIEDKEGNIWIGTWGGGLNKFDPVTERFTIYENQPDDPGSFPHDKAQVLFIDNKDQLWIGTAGGGLSMFNKETEDFENYTHSDDPNSISNNRLWSITQEQNGIFWIGTDYGLNRFDPNTGSFQSYLYETDNNSSLSNNQVRQTYVDKDGLVWIGTATGLDRYDPETDGFIHYHYDKDNINKNSVNKIYEDALNNFWVGTHIGGLKLFNKKSGQFTSYRNDPENNTTLSYDDVRDILLDNSNILWITTRGGGINKLDLKPAKFKYYAHDPADKNSLLDNRVKSIYEDAKGTLWIGTDVGGGLNKFNRKTNKYTHYKHNKNNPNSIASNDITAITGDSKGQLWLGTDGYGMDRFDPVNQNFRHFRHDPKNKNSLCSDEVWDIEVDADGNLWIGTNRGLDRYNPNTNQFTHYKHDKNDPKSLSNNTIWNIFIDASERIWVGTDDGLNLYLPATDNFKVYGLNAEQSNGLTNSTINSIYEDNSNTLWIGTEFGLHRFNEEDQTFTFFPDKNIALGVNAIFGILADENNNLWLSTINGLSRFNIDTKSYRRYDIHDGLQNNDYSRDACFKSHTGEFVFGGVNGFNIFNPDSVLDNSFVPNVVFTDFQLFNKSLKTGSKKLPKSVNYTDEIKLSYNENYFSIGFAALNYTITEKNKYKCILEGFDENWIDLDTRRYNHYTNVPPGDYEFKVIGSNNDGIWNNQASSLKITITPPIWKTTGFIILEIIVAILVILGIIRLRTRRLLLSKKELENIVRKRTLELSDQKEELETALALISKQKDGLKEANIKIQENTKLKEEFLAKTSHELRTPLNVIVGFANLLLNEKLNDKQQSYLREIKSSTDNLLVVINDILTFSKIESGKLNIEIIEFDFEISMQTIFNSFNIKAGEKGIKYQFEYDKSIPKYVFGAPVRLNQVISNLIDNAIKFTEKSGDVIFSIKNLFESEKHVDIEFKIKDTGIGMDLDKYENLYESFSQASSDTTRKFGGTGLGLSIVKRLVELMDGKIQVSSKPGKGTTFTIHFSFEKGKGEKLETKTTDYHIDKSSGKEQKNILLVEDNPVNVILAMDTIRLYNPNINIESAENGKVALEMLKKKNYDLVILDIQMPVMDGYETTKIIRQQFDPPMRDVPILAMSAHALEEEKDKCISLGMNEYITKPFVPDELFTKIEAITQITANSGEETHVHKADVFSFNFKNLDAIYKGDEKKINKIVSICLQNIPSQLGDLENSIKQKDFKSIQIYSHSVKTSLGYLGIEEMVSYAQSIEDFADKQENGKDIEAIYDKINDGWKIMEKELKTYLNKNNK